MQPIFRDETELLGTLKKGDSRAFEFLYRSHYRMVASLVLQNSGQEADAKELFQDTMVALFRQFRDRPDFVLQTRLGTYIYAIARNLWLKKLRQRRNQPFKLVEDETQLEGLPADESMNLNEMEYEEKHHVIKEILYTLKKECRDIIEYAFFRKWTGAEIASELGYTEDFVKVKKFRCMKTLKLRVLEHPLFKES